MNLEIFNLQPIGFLTPTLQIIAISFLFILTILLQYKEYRKTGKTLRGRFQSPTFFFFCPIYEEVIFRGFILSAVLTLYPVFIAIVVSSLLFGLWHLKNIFVFSRRELILQIVCTTVILGPITALLTVYTGTIWIAVIVHYFNNLFASAALGKVGKVLI
jgi:membrane protease YdiL (CAAX protease family)